MIEGKIVRVSMLNYFYQLIRDIFVLQETGKGLSTNDYTTDENTAVAKIADIETDLEGKVDGEVYDESGYVTGVSFKKGSYAISMGTNMGDPRISIKNDTTVNFDLAQTKELTKDSSTKEMYPKFFTKDKGTKDKCTKDNFTNDFKIPKEKT